MSLFIKSYFRNFKRQKLIYSITIGGFAVSLAILVLISSYVMEERSVDRHLPQFQEMYRIKQSDGNATIPQRMYDKILATAPEIEKLCLINTNGVFYGYNNKKRWSRALATNKEFLDIFSVKILDGSKEGLLDAKTDVIITKSFAKKVFGDKNPLGEVLEFENSEKKVVQAVIENPQKRSSLKYDVIFNLENNLFSSVRGFNGEKYKMFDAVFVINPETNIAEVESKIAKILQPYEGYKETILKVQPFKEVYFNPDKDNDGFSHVNINMIKLLSWVAFIILLLAILNYINLTTAFNNERHKEICIRKTSGAKRIAIFGQFIKESYLSCGIALFLAIGLAWLISPLFTDLFGRELAIMESLNQSYFIIVLLFILVVVGGITGLVPAIAVSRLNPITLMHRKATLKNSGLRGLFNAFQLFATISLVVALIVIVKQINFVKTKDVGFNKEHLLSVELSGKTCSKASIIKENLLAYPDILNVSGSNGIPFNINMSGSGSWSDDSVEFKISNISHMNTDTSFLSTFGLQLVKGRNFRVTDKDVCIINEKTYNYLNLDGLECKTIWGSKIVGVVKDFHFKKMHEELGFIQLKYEPENVNHLNIRIVGNNIPQTIDRIKSALKEIEPGMNFNIQFYDDKINAMYKKEEKQAKAIKIFVVLALFLSCLGLLGLAEFSSIKRTKEIGVRKVNGAKVSEVLIMLNKDFVKWVLIAFVFATPVAYYAMTKWLENFAYKTELSWWIFTLAGVLAFGITLLTVSWQSWKAATRNPVEALRYE